MINGRGLMGLGAGGCVSGEVDGECMYGGQSISCKLIRECDAMTGIQHFEYGTPGGRSGNVNIEVRDGNGQIVGRTDKNGSFISVSDPRYGNFSTRNQGGNVTATWLQEAAGIAGREALVRYPMDAAARAIYTAQRIAQLMKEHTTVPDSTINTNADGGSGTTIPTTTPEVVQETSFTDLLTGKFDDVSAYVQDRDNWLMLGIGGAAAVAALVYMSSGRGRRY